MPRYQSNMRAQVAGARPHHMLAQARAEARVGAWSKAAAILRACVEQHPKHAEAWSDLGDALTKVGDGPGALDAYKQATRCQPRVAAGFVKLADLHRRQGDLALALEACEMGLALSETKADALLIRALIRRQLGQWPLAIDDLQAVFHARPDALPVLALLAEADLEAGRPRDAEDRLARQGTPSPVLARVYQRLVGLHVEAGAYDRAVPWMDAQIVCAPRDAELHRKRGLIDERRGHAAEAVIHYERSIQCDPRHTYAYENLGSLLLKTGLLREAIAVFRRGVAVAPTDGNAHYNLGLALRFAEAFDEAALYLTRAVSLAPTHADALAELIYVRQMTCDWDGLDALAARLDAMCRGGAVVSPFKCAISFMPPNELQLCARRWSARFGAKGGGPAVDAPRPATERRGRIKVGYVSNDFHNHATAILIVGLLEHHDRDRFEIVAFSFGPDDGSPLRTRVIQGVDAFVDLRGTDDATAAAIIRERGIDILVDLKGYTLGARTEIFAARPAPIQVNYLGYPGTMGAGFIDYLVADRFVVPLDHATHYDERIVYLPHCYQPNDDKRDRPDARVEQAGFGLPVSGFVFCSFNNSYKITAEVFDVWMRLLHAVPGSVLWLLEANPSARTNLERHAASRGIAPERLVFAPRVHTAIHLSRLSRADLFLDTLPCNAHTTASEALWAGLPVLTCAGGSFAGRVAGSILHAAGFPDLVVSSLAAYEAKALAIARDPASLSRIRDRLRHDWRGMPLFDTRCYARGLEDAFVQMVALRDAGLQPRTIAVQ